MVIPVQVLGDGLLALLLVLTVVVIDTLTKWTAIAIRYCKDKEYEPSPMNVLRAIFFRAWEQGYLESKLYKWNIIIKSIAYSTVILLSVLIYLLFPYYEMNGFHIGKIISLMLYVFVVLAELFSIAENLKEAGYERSRLMDKVLEASLQKMGVNFQVDDKIPPDLPQRINKEMEKVSNNEKNRI